MLPIKTILHPTDFSEPSRFAFEMACALARDYGGQLIICHVLQPTIPLSVEGVIPPLAEDYEAQVGETLLQIRPAASIPVVHLLESGQPVEEILRLAKESRVDLIVMGTHGRRGIRRMLLGSVAERVMREAPCPVLTVKTPFIPQAPRERYTLTRAEEKHLPFFAAAPSFHSSGEF